MASEKFAQRMRDPSVAHDVRVVADFIRIWCDGNHRDRVRGVAPTEGGALGVYRKRHVLCAECAEHLVYAEKRRAYCPMDPKPFCAHCDSQCYSPSEQEWQRTMMRYSGPRSVLHGHAIDGIKHALEARRYRTETVRKAAEASAQADEETS
ncbi:MAG TPA: nitrous oxide-stimulated promoter family protein [Coriobacteriia bacterium]